jgi:hypothetical protein
MVKRMNDYDLLVNYLQEQHNEVFHQWANVKEQLDILEREKEVQREQEQLERTRPQLLELANWCDLNKEWMEQLSDNSDNINAILLSVDLMIEAAYDGNLSLIGTYKTAIRSIGSKIPELHVVGYLKDGKRVITPFNHCWYHTHGDDVKFDSNTEYDWREEE